MLLKCTNFFCLAFLLFNTATIAQTTCPVPTVTTVADSTKIVVNWTVPTTNSSATTTYSVQYTAAPITNTTTWITTTTTPNKTFTISNLAKCTYYSVRVKSNCSATSSSNWSTVALVKTLGCIACVAPKISSFVSDSTKITVNWTGTTGATGHILEYTTSPVTITSIWKAVTATTSPSSIIGLTKCKDYVFRLKAICSPTSTSLWSEYKSAKTTGCAVVSSCIAPTIGTSSTDSTKITLNWTPAVTGASYTIEYITLPTSPTSVPITVTATTNSYVFSNFKKCTEYAFRVKTNCSPNLSSPWSSYKTLKTSGCAITFCPKPNFTTSPDTTSIKLNWIPSYSVLVEYALAPATGTTVTPTWTHVTTLSTSALISNLVQCKEYVIRMRNKCSATFFSEWEYKTVKTTGCKLPCAKPEYIAFADSNKITLSWAANPNYSVQIEFATPPVTGTTTTPTWTPVASLNNPTTISGLTKCKEYVIRIRTKCSATLFSEWEYKTVKTSGCVAATCPAPTLITGNVDSTRITLNWSPSITGVSYTIEYISLPSSVTTIPLIVIASTNSYTFSNLAKCKEYAFRIRANCSANFTSSWSAVKTFKTTGCQTAYCPKPIFTAVADSNKIALTWIANANYNVQLEYSTGGAIGTSVTPTWIPVSGTTITGLTKCKEYIVRMRTKCSSDFFSDWEYKTVKTTGCPILLPCIRPISLASTPITGGVVLNWNGTAPYYQIRYSRKTAGTVAWRMIDSVKTLTYTLTGLDACLFYAWQVRSRCASGVWSDWTSSAVFETGGCNNRVAKIMTLSPNPGSYLNIDYALQKSGKVMFEIANLQGKIVEKHEIGIQNEGLNHYNLDDLQIPAGLYMVTIRVNGIRQEVQRWSKITE